MCTFSLSRAARSLPRTSLRARTPQFNRWFLEISEQMYLRTRSRARIETHDYVNTNQPDGWNPRLCDLKTTRCIETQVYVNTKQSSWLKLTTIWQADWNPRICEHKATRWIKTHDLVNTKRPGRLKPTTLPAPRPPPLFFWGGQHCWCWDGGATNSGSALGRKSFGPAAGFM